MTPGQKWRRKRDLVIGALWAIGIPKAFLADVFDLTRSRVSVILDDLGAERKSESASVGLQRLAPIIWVMGQIGKVNTPRKKGE